MHSEITEITRRAIIDHLIAGDINWSGRLEEDDFLSRLYDLTKLPSTDFRMSNAAGDIWQHRVRWQDWPDDWVFHDSRFNLLHTSDEEFLRFICETVHPVVRPDLDEVLALVEMYNSALSKDGWELVEGRRISDKPVFVSQKRGQRAQVYSEPTGWRKVDRQLQEVRLRLDTAETEEQYQAVGLLCREVLITVAQEVYDTDFHRAPDGVIPSKTDAVRMIEAYVGSELRGSPNEESRAHAKAALRLALALQHKRTADYRMAALCAEGASSVVNILAVLSGRRGRRV